MADKVKVDQLAAVVMEGLTEYADLATDDLKKAVRKSAKTVKDGIMENAPQHTGAYKKSWTTKTTAESANKLEITVYSKNRYQLAHLLEKGHAKRNGGRVSAQVHIAPAEEKGVKELEEEIERSLQSG